MAPEMGGLGMRTFFFFSSLLPPRVGGWVAPHIAVVTRRTFAPPSPQKKGKSLSRRDPKNTSEFLCENFMYEWGGGLPPSTSMLGWLRCKKDSMIHIPSAHSAHVPRVSGPCFLSIIQSHYKWNWPHKTYGCMVRTKHMAAWSDPRKKKL